MLARVVGLTRRAKDVIQRTVSEARQQAPINEGVAAGATFLKHDAKRNEIAFFFGVKVW